MGVTKTNFRETYDIYECKSFVDNTEKVVYISGAELILVRATLGTGSSRGDCGTQVASVIHMSLLGLRNTLVTQFGGRARNWELMT